MTKKKTPKTPETAAGKHSLHILLTLEDYRRLRMLAAEKLTSVGKLASELLTKAMDAEKR